MRTSSFNALSSILLAGLLIPLAVFAEQPECITQNGPLHDKWVYRLDVVRSAPSCSGCTAVCSAIGSKSEGWYDSCDDSLIVYENCDRSDEFHGEKISLKDLPQNHPDYEAVRYLVNEGIVQGYDDGTYRPDAQINRAEFTKIIVGATNEKMQIDTCLNDMPDSFKVFSDIVPGEWFENFVCTAKNTGLIGGYPDGTFRPNQAINFVEAAKIVARAFQPDIQEAGDGDPEWFTPYVLFLEERYAIPMSIQTFNQVLTRGEMAQIIWRIKAGVTTEESNEYYSLAENFYAGQHPQDDGY